MERSPEKEKSLGKRVKEGKLTPKELKEIERGVKRAEKLAFALDTAMVDPILGLFEGGGDAGTAVAGLYIVYQAKKAGMSYWELSKMLGRQTLDLVGGSIPIVGDIFDFLYKSNNKNAQALRKHFEKIEKLTMKTQIASLEKRKLSTEKGTVEKLGGLKREQLKSTVRKAA